MLRAVRRRLPARVTNLTLLVALGARLRDRRRSGRDREYPRALDRARARRRRPAPRRSRAREVPDRQGGAAAAPGRPVPLAPARGAHGRRRCSPASCTAPVPPIVRGSAHALVPRRVRPGARAAPRAGTSRSVAPVRAAPTSPGGCCCGPAASWARRPRSTPSSPWARTPAGLPGAPPALHRVLRDRVVRPREPARHDLARGRRPARRPRRVAPHRGRRRRAARAAVSRS